MAVISQDPPSARRAARLLSHNVHAVRIGWHGLAEAEKDPELFAWADVVVVDLGDGADKAVAKFESLVASFGDAPHAPGWVVCTSRPESALLEACDQRGDPIVPRPFTSVELRGAVKYVYSTRCPLPASVRSDEIAA